MSGATHELCLVARTEQRSSGLGTTVQGMCLTQGQSTWTSDTPLPVRGVDYVIIIDYFSRYVEVAAMTIMAKQSEVIRALKSIFTRHGTPVQVRSDNGPQLDSAEFSHFAKEWRFKWTTSSPKFPQLNGEVERRVRTVKNLLTTEKDPAKGLLAHWSTTLACKFSPA